MYQRNRQNKEVYRASYISKEKENDSKVFWWRLALVYSILNVSEGKYGPIVILLVVRFAWLVVC